MKRLILIIFLLSSLLYAGTADFLEPVKIASPSHKNILMYDINGVWKNVTYDSLGISTTKIIDDDGDTYVDVESTTDADSVIIASPNGYFFANNDTYMLRFS